MTGGREREREDVVVLVMVSCRPQVVEGFLKDRRA